jgi:hypothetical protein
VRVWEINDDGFVSSTASSRQVVQSSQQTDGELRTSACVMLCLFAAPYIAFLGDVDTLICARGSTIVRCCVVGQIVIFDAATTWSGELAMVAKYVAAEHRVMAMCSRTSTQQGCCVGVHSCCRGCARWRIVDVRRHAIECGHRVHAHRDTQRTGGAGCR